MKIKEILTKNFKILGLGGILGSWFTISAIWAGVATLPLVGFVVTSGLFGLALLGTGR
jgi:hypothetical protein